MKFEDERMLAARDLLARIPLASARVVYDLGCGPGNSAELLSRRFPDADITGLDTSEAMLDHARTRAPRARFVKQNIVDWVPTEPPNLIFANAALDFLSDHHALFPRLAATLAPGGVFAAQMPSTARESSHALMRMVAAEGPWSSRLVPVAKTQPMIAEFEDLWRRMSSHSLSRTLMDENGRMSTPFQERGSRHQAPFSKGPARPPWTLPPLGANSSKYTG